MKSYLKELYSVDTVHVRSFVTQRGLTRRQHPSQKKQGAWYRPESIKTMVVQLVEPFEWPKPVEDLTE